MGRKTYIVVMFASALSCFALGIAVGNLAWDWWGEPCHCTDLAGPFGSWCTDTCISIGSLSVSKGWGAPLLSIALPALGTALAGSLLEKAGDAGHADD